MALIAKCKLQERGKFQFACHVRYTYLHLGSGLSSSGSVFLGTCCILDNGFGVAVWQQG
jgi:hypothetical protein